MCASLIANAGLFVHAITARPKTVSKRDIEYVALPAGNYDREHAAIDESEYDNKPYVEQTRYAQFSNLTDYEKGLLVMVVYREARGEPYDGMKAVVECVFNRVLSDKFPDNIYDVIYAENQFSSAKLLTTKPIIELNKLTECYKAVDDVIEESTYRISDACFFFNTGDKHPSYAILIGQHWFY